VIWSIIGCVMVEMAVAVAVAFWQWLGRTTGSRCRLRGWVAVAGWQWIETGYLLSLKWRDLEHYWLCYGGNGSGSGSGFLAVVGADHRLKMSPARLGDSGWVAVD
jgi:hypothetical protein